MTIDFSDKQIAQFEGKLDVLFNGLDQIALEDGLNSEEFLPLVHVYFGPNVGLAYEEYVRESWGLEREA